MTHYVETALLNERHVGSGVVKSPKQGSSHIDLSVRILAKISGDRAGNKRQYLAADIIDTEEPGCLTKPDTFEVSKAFMLEYCIPSYGATNGVPNPHYSLCDAPTREELTFHHRKLSDNGAYVVVGPLSDTRTAPSRP